MSAERPLPRAPAVLFFYGLAGAGKTHVGQWVARETGRWFHDADDDISDEMRQALAEQRPFTDTMRDAYFPRVVERIQRLQQQHETLVVTQGVYKQRHREYLQQAIPGVALVCVQCSLTTLQRRLSERQGGISSASAAALLADFEPPPADWPVLVNEGNDADVMRQLIRWYGS